VVALIVVGVLAVLAVFIALTSDSHRSPGAAPRCSSGSVAYHRTLEPGLTIITPFIDRVRPLIDLREQVVNFSPQPGDHRGQRRRQHRDGALLHDHRRQSASYEIAAPLQAIEQLTVTTLRNVIGGLTLEQTLTAAKASIRSCARRSTRPPGKWGIRINRVEIKSVSPPADIKAAMEKQNARRARPPRRDPDPPRAPSRPRS